MAPAFVLVFTEFASISMRRTSPKIALSLVSDERYKSKSAAEVSVGVITEFAWSILPFSCAYTKLRRTDGYDPLISKCQPRRLFRVVSTLPSPWYRGNL